MQNIWFTEFMMVGAGGFIGSGLRYTVAVNVERLFPYSSFPYGTATVNFIGCFFIGYLASTLAVREMFEPALKLFLLAGVLGGFTTFSAFSLENLMLLQNSKASIAALNIVVQVGTGLFAAWGGFQIAKVF